MVRPISASNWAKYCEAVSVAGACGNGEVGVGRLCFDVSDNSDRVVSNFRDCAIIGPFDLFGPFDLYW